MKYVVRYSVIGDRAVDLPVVYPRHKAYLDAFEPAHDIVGVGTFDEPVTNGSMAIFRTRESAERFVASDPFVVEGLVAPGAVLAWKD